jgi:hypothetical protein
MLCVLCSAVVRYGDTVGFSSMQGCGTRVPSVRIEVEEVLRDVAVISSSQGRPPPVLVRVNASADDAVLGEEVLACAPASVSIRGGGMDTLRAIDEALSTASS